MGQEAGHSFLARLGKTKLRPGGIEATNWLIEQAKINQHSTVLEVACNMGTTLVQVATKYHCQITGIDQSQTVIEQATQNIENHHLTDYASVFRANAMKLPFEDNSFDVIINEAMLTMLDEKSKAKAIHEYYRVLKPGGYLLTHDVCLINGDNAALVEQLGQTIHVHAQPLTPQRWETTFKDVGFTVTQKFGGMTLMNPLGMIHDEGLPRTLKIIRNGLKNENRQQFFKMFSFFRSNSDQLGYIANLSQKNSTY